MKGVKQEVARGTLKQDGDLHNKLRAANNPVNFTLPIEIHWNKIKFYTRSVFL